MSTLAATSAVFNEVSGPHEGPGSHLPLWAPQMGLGEGESNYQTDFMGPNTVLQTGPTILHIGQVVPFTIFLNNGVRLTRGTDGMQALRGRLEARGERGGLFTKCIFVHQSGQHIIWTVGPQNAPMTEDNAKKILRDAILEELPGLAGASNTVVVFSTQYPVTGQPLPWLRTPEIPWQSQMEEGGLGSALVRKLAKLVGIDGPDWLARRTTGPLRGLGDIFTDIARGATSVSADMMCSPAFQAMAAQDVARRYGEDHARTFREAFRQATTFCSPGAMARAEARRQEEEKRQAWLIGGGVVAVAAIVLGTWYFSGKKANGRRRKRRNIDGPDWRGPRRGRRRNGKKLRWSQLLASRHARQADAASFLWERGFNQDGQYWWRSKSQGAGGLGWRHPSDDVVEIVPAAAPGERGSSKWRIVRVKQSNARRSR